MGRRERTKWRQTPEIVKIVETVRVDEAVAVEERVAAAAAATRR